MPGVEAVSKFHRLLVRRLVALGKWASDQLNRRSARQLRSSVEGLSKGSFVDELTVPISLVGQLGDENPDGSVFEALWKPTIVTPIEEARVVDD